MSFQERRWGRVRTKGGGGRRHAKGTGLRRNHPALEPGLPDSGAVRRSISAARAALRARCSPHRADESGGSRTGQRPPRRAACCSRGGGRCGTGKGLAVRGSSVLLCRRLGDPGVTCLLSTSGPRARGVGRKLSESLPGTQRPDSHPPAPALRLSWRQGQNGSEFCLSSRERTASSSQKGLV